MDLTDPRTLKALLSRYGFRFSKRMGQNFLIASWVPQRIAEAAGLDSACGVLEVGPGVGCLTVELAKRAGRVTAVELDRSLLPVLSETLADAPNAEVVSGDVLRLDLPEFTAQRFPGMSVRACANLPYNITTPVLTQFLESGCFDSVTVMIQREVAQRICAEPGSPACGAFSLFCQYYARCETLFDVPPACFYPPPKVTSSVVRLTPWNTPPVAGNRDAILQVVRAAFAQRRKTLLNALNAAYGSRFSKEQLREIIITCGLPEDVRGERLGLTEFARLAEHLQSP